MRYLAAVDTVHTAAAICDYLGDRLDATDEVVAVAVAPAGTAAGGPDDAPTHRDSDDARTARDSDTERDGREALNVLAVRLVGPDVETEIRHGDPAEELLAAANAHDVDEIVLGIRAGEPGADDGLGSTAEAVLAGAGRPVVVLPSAGV